MEIFAGAELKQRINLLSLSITANPSRCQRYKKRLRPLPPHILWGMIIEADGSDPRRGASEAVAAVLGRLPR
ncbi:hypothetical protein AV530_009077 [Patagioenas fasciata monilis]|uniref:Uncharacterized protein n=1 Tax=Patagioenas fasciata monilis TaxID=372326 RepID=A0A1V4L0F7_PATFA|nr:hypothetical protein AV530_009077 [Patagioenas fasciata monilis]